MKLTDKYKIIVKNPYSSFIKININGYDYLYVFIITLYQALLQKGWYLPRFCFHSKLSIAGNCRMCFVELKNVSKPIVSCATNISANLFVYTNTLLSFKSRESILEFILINHPIDCPICDQGGECDLQDQYIVMGSSNSRFYEKFKKSVKNKNISYLVKLSLNKCINCTRCSRFSQQIGSDYSFSLLGRGENSNISNYIKNFYNFEISGNVMDICPVGALTSKIISYDFRIWELIDLKFIDIDDVMHPPIRIDFRGLRVQRILPLSNPETEEEWISDFLRYSFRFMFKNRFYLPQLKKKIIFISLSWNNFLTIFKNLYVRLFIFFFKKKMFFSQSTLLNKNKSDIYQYNFYCFFFKKFNILSNYKLNFKKFNFNRNFYLKNKDLYFLKVENIYICFLNFRFDFPLFSYRLREKMIFDYINIFSFGPLLNLNYFCKHVGNSFNSFNNFFLKNKFDINHVFFFSLKEKYLFNYLKLKNNDDFKLMTSHSLNIIAEEFGYYKCFIYNKFKSLFSFNFINSSKFSSKSLINLLFTQNFLNLKNFNIIVPKKFNFEQNSIFINIFGVFNDFTFLAYKSDHKTLKSDWNFFSSFFKKFKFKKRLTLSAIKSRYVSKSWVFAYYNFIVGCYLFLNFSSALNLNILYGYKVNIEKIKNKFLIKLQNKFLGLLNINKISWLF